MIHPDEPVAEPKKRKIRSLIVKAIYLLLFPIVWLLVPVIGFKYGYFIIYLYFLIPILSSVRLYNESKKECNANRAGPILLTVLCLIMFHLLFVFSLFSVMVFDNPSITPLRGFIIMFLFFCLPLSFSVSIYLIWSNIRKNRSYFLGGLLPWLILVLVWLFGDLFINLISTH